MPKDKIHIVNVSTFPPRKCGIASFASDMVENLGTSNWDVCPIVRNPGSTKYDSKHRRHVLTEIDQNDDSSYEQGALAIVNYARELRGQEQDLGVYLNHEFGIFADDHTRDNAVKVLEILRDANIATGVVGHTVLYYDDRSDFEQKREVLGKMIRTTDKFVCLTPSALHRLMDEEIYGSRFGVGRGKLVCIRHGIPEIDIPKRRDDLKRDYTFVKENGELKTVFTSVGFLSRSKGLEYAIDGYSQFLGGRRDRNNFLYVVAGGTHEDVKGYEGESYRNELVQRAKNNKLAGAIITRDEEGKGHITDLDGTKLNDIKNANLVFLNAHLSDDELLMIMKTSDCGVIGNLEKNQISSGPGAYWIGSSRATIATESIFFKDMEEEGIGLLVPFRDSGAIAKSMEHFANLSLKEREDDLEFPASDFGTLHLWSDVGGQYYKLMRKLVHHKAGKRD